MRSIPTGESGPAGGDDKIMQGRYGFACPNSPYRDYIRDLLRELVGSYEFEAIFVDMTMWPDVCYCPHCTARFWNEHNSEPPRIVDWDDPAWRKFQKARQSWLLDFVNDMTRTVKQIRPISVLPPVRDRLPQLAARSAARAGGGLRLRDRRFLRRPSVPLAGMQGIHQPDPRSPVRDGHFPHDWHDRPRNHQADGADSGRVVRAHGFTRPP